MRFVLYREAVLNGNVRAFSVLRMTQHRYSIKRRKTMSKTEIFSQTAENNDEDRVRIPTHGI